MILKPNGIFQAIILEYLIIARNPETQNLAIALLSFNFDVILCLFVKYI